MKTKPHLYTDTGYMITSPVKIILQHVGESDYTMHMTGYTMQMTGYTMHMTGYTMLMTGYTMQMTDIPMHVADRVNNAGAQCTLAQVSLYMLVTRYCRLHYLGTVRLQYTLQVNDK